MSDPLQRRLQLSWWKLTTGILTRTWLALAALSLASGGAIAWLAIQASPAGALGALGALWVLGLGLAAAAVIHQIRLASSALQARLTLDQLQQGNPLWHQSTSYTAAPEFLLEAVRAMTAEMKQSKTVVELGCGASTLVLARIIRSLKLPCQLISVEHDKAYAEAVQRRLGAEGLGELVRLIHSPLEPLETAGYAGPWYQSGPILAQVHDIDILIVDGPPKCFGKDIRFPALPVLHSRLKPAATVLLDDARRSAERRILRRWSKLHPQARVALSPHGRGIGRVDWPG